MGVPSGHGGKATVSHARWGGQPETATNDHALAGLGVARIGLQRTGTPSNARLASERTRAVIHHPIFRGK